MGSVFPYVCAMKRLESQLAACVSDYSVPALSIALLTIEINTSLDQLLSPLSPLIAHLHNSTLWSLHLLYLLK